MVGSRTRKWVGRLVPIMVFLIAGSAWAAGGGGAEPIVFVADSRGMTGWRAWWTNLYNESHLYFTIATVIIIPLVGSILGVLTDLMMSRIGINLKSRVLAEH